MNAVRTLDAAEPATNSVQTPAYLQFGTSLMEDLVPADVVDASDGENKVALFANPFAEGTEEALVIDSAGYLTYVKRDLSLATGWTQSRLYDSGAWITATEVVVIVHPADLSVWAVVADATKALKTLQLTAGSWQANSSAIAWAEGLTLDNRPEHLSVYYDNNVPFVFGVDSVTAAPFYVVASADVPPPFLMTGSSTYTKLLQRPVDQFACGYVTGSPAPLQAFFRSGSVLYLDLPSLSGPDGSVRQVDTDVKEIVGIWRTPGGTSLSDHGCVYLKNDGQLCMFLQRRENHGQIGIVGKTGFETASLWRDAQGMHHVYGRDGSGNLKVLHQASWGGVGPGGTGWLDFPQWAQAQPTSFVTQSVQPNPCSPTAMLTFSAQVTSTQPPVTGDVSFYTVRNGGRDLATGGRLDTSGNVSAKIPAQYITQGKPGVFDVIAVYAGDATHLGAESDPLTVSATESARPESGELVTARLSAVPYVPVTVGLFSGVGTFVLDPYPDYKPSEWFWFSGAPAAEQFCIATQDISTAEWAVDTIRLPSTGDPHRVIRHVADVKLSGPGGVGLSGRTVVLSADTLVHALVAGRSYLIGPGRPVAVETNVLGKVTVSVVPNGLSTPALSVSADSAASGVTIEFNKPLLDYLGGKSTLPSQPGLFDARALENATYDKNSVTPKKLIPDWRKYPGLSPQNVVDHCRTMYALAAGEQPPRQLLAGTSEPQAITGYVFQTWDPSKPCFQAFTTPEELREHRAYLTAHPDYGGILDGFGQWLSDIWAGICRTGERLVHIFVDLGSKTVEFFTMAGGYLIKLGELLVDSMLAAGEAMIALFNELVDKMFQLFGWLGATFNFQDIIDTKKAIDGVIAQIPKYIVYYGNKFKGISSGWFAEREGQVTAIFEDLKTRYAGQSIAFDNSPAQPAGLDLSAVQNDPQANQLANLVMGLGGEMTKIPGNPFQGIMPEIEKFWGTLTGGEPGKTPGDLLVKAFTDIKDVFVACLDLSDPAKVTATGIVKILDAIEQLILAFLTLMDHLAQATVDLLVAFADSIIAMLNEPIDLGWITLVATWIFEQLGVAGPNVSYGDFFGYLMAFPATIGYKLIMGADHPPFPGGKAPALPDPETGEVAGGAGDANSYAMAMTGLEMYANIVYAVAYMPLDSATDLDFDNLLPQFISFAYTIEGLAVTLLMCPATYAPSSELLYWGYWGFGLLYYTLNAFVLYRAIKTPAAGNGALLKTATDLTSLLTTACGAGTLITGCIAAAQYGSSVIGWFNTVLGSMSNLTAFAFIGIKYLDPADQAAAKACKAFFDGICNAACGATGIAECAIAVSSVQQAYKGRIGQYSSASAMLLQSAWPGDSTLAPSPNAVAGMDYLPFAGSGHGFQLVWGVTEDPFTWTLDGAGWLTATPGSQPAWEGFNDAGTTGDSAPAVPCAAIGGIPDSAGSVAAALTVTNSWYPPFSDSYSWTINVASSPVGQIVAQNGSTPQTVNIGSSPQNPLSVLVTDQQGKPVSGAYVEFAAPVVGPSGTFTGSDPDSPATISVATDSAGVATVAFVANDNDGPYNVVAAPVGTTLSAQFSLTNVTAVQTLTPTSGSTPQTAVPGQPFAQALAVTATDPSGKPVANVTVTFTAPSGGGASGTFAGGGAQYVADTDAAGLATASAFTANALNGAYGVTASAAGASSAAVFELENLSGAATLAAVSPGSQYVPANYGLGVPLAVVAKDSSGAAVPGVAVTFTAPASGASGTFGGANPAAPDVVVVTGQDGTATAPGFTANNQTGAYTVTASASGTQPVGFSLTNVADPESIAVNAGSNQSAPVGTVYPVSLSVIVKDAASSPVPGAVIQFYAPVIGPSCTFGPASQNSASAITDSNGIAVAPAITANGAAGSFTVDAGPAYQGIPLSAPFTLTNQA